MQLQDYSAVSVTSLREEDEKVKRRLSNIRYTLTHHLSNLRKFCAFVTSYPVTMSHICIIYYLTLQQSCIEWETDVFFDHLNQ